MRKYTIGIAALIMGLIFGCGMKDAAKSASLLHFRRK